MKLKKLSCRSLPFCEYLLDYTQDVTVEKRTEQGQRTLAPNKKKRAILVVSID